MATSAPTARRAAASPPPDDSPVLTWLVTWIKGHRQITGAVATVVIVGRSEERRVGKECRSRWSPYH